VAERELNGVVWGRGTDHDGRCVLVSRCHSAFSYSVDITWTVSLWERSVTALNWPPQWTYKPAILIIIGGWFKRRAYERFWAFDRCIWDLIWKTDRPSDRHTSKVYKVYTCITTYSRSQWPRGLRRGSATARSLGLWVRIPRVAWLSLCSDCCMLSGRGLCVGLITRPEDSYQVWCDWVWSWSFDNEKALANYGLWCQERERT
jgi:hypothetical protein